MRRSTFADWILDRERIRSLRVPPHSPKRPFFDRATRTVDLILSTPALIVASPLILATAWLIRHQDGGPAFFVQERAGLDGRIFRMIKFRTMVPDAVSMGAGLSLDPSDTRITRLGRVLRRWHIDEVPQLTNVVRGEMAIVGPRPVLTHQPQRYEAWERQRLAVRPGMTGLSQVVGGNRRNWDERIAIDVYYVRNRRFGLWIRIVLWTFLGLVSGEGTYDAAGGVRGWTRGVPIAVPEATGKPPLSISSRVGPAPHAE